MKTVLLTGLSWLLLSLPVAAEENAHDHHMNHGSAPEMDEQGRRLDADMDHELTPEQLEALREKIALYRALTDREAQLNMAMMGPNYEWYVSDSSLNGDVGVLVLSHGVGENSDELFVETLKPMAAKRPTAVSFGMAMMMSSHIQSATDDLTAAGAETIVLVPTALTEHNTLTRQWQYVFGMIDESSYLDVPRVQTDADVVMTAHFDAHPLITGILADYIDEVSTDPANEVVILVGHGPEDIEDNVLDLEVLQPHVDRIAEKGFAEVKLINVQDDAYPPIRAANVKKMRRWVSGAARKGQTPIVVVVASASFGVQAHIREDLRGLEYVFVEKGLSQHPDYQLWIETAVEERLAAGLN